MHTLKLSSVESSARGAVLWSSKTTSYLRFILWAHRMEQPLGGLPPYHSVAMHNGGFDRQQPQHPPPLHLQQQFGSQPHLQPGQFHQSPLHLQQHLQVLAELSSPLAIRLKRQACVCCGADEVLHRIRTRI